MKNNEKKLFLIKNGLSIDLVTGLNEGQTNSMYKRLIESKKEKCPCGCDKDTCPCGPNCKKCDCGKKKKQETKEAVTTVAKTGFETKITPGSSASLSLDGNQVKVDPNKGIEIMSKTKPVGTGETTESKEIDEKAVSKKQQEFFGVVRGMQKGDIPKKGKAGKAAEEMSKKDVKDFASTKHKGLPKRKETKEGYLDMIGKAHNKGLQNKISDIKLGVNYEDALEESINSIIDSVIQPKMSKKDLLKLIRESNPLEVSPEEETITKPTKPDTKPGINPDFDPFKNPDPSDDPEAGKDFFVSMAKDMGMIKK